MRLVPTDLDLGISHPDHVRNSGSITFIYSPEDNKFYSGEYPAIHNDLITWNKLNSSHMSLRNKGFIFGRIGESEESASKENAIVFYGFLSDPQDIDDYEPVSEADAKKAIHQLVIHYPNFDYENMYVVLLHGLYDEEAITYKLEDVRSGNTNQTKEDDPDCQRIGVPVNGQEMSIKQILSNLHMVRGDQIEKIRHGFCPLSQKLNQQTSDKCPSLNKAINYISRNLKCGQEDYRNILNQGKQGYRQQLKGVFGNPDAMDSEFRTQKDLDKAWDFYRKAESVMGFQQWMKRKIK